MNHELELVRSRGMLEHRIDELTRWDVRIDAASVVYESGVVSAQVEQWLNDEVLNNGYKLGYRRRPFGLWGYNGSVIGHIAWGRNSKRNLIVIAKNEGVREFWLGGWLLAGRATRIDVALDVKVGKGNEDEAIAAQLAPIEAKQAKEGSNAKKCKYIDGRGEGDTLYVGRRASDDYTRIYNKYAESGFNGVYEGIVRFETEFKQKSAEEYYGLLQTATSVGEVSGAYLSFLQDTGVIGVDAVNPGYRERNKPSRGRTEDEITRRWLHTQVRGAVERLVKKYGKKAIMMDLGLEDIWGEFDEKIKDL